jgi:hypothetical protein
MCGRILQGQKGASSDRKQEYSQYVDFTGIEDDFGLKTFLLFVIFSNIFGHILHPPIFAPREPSDTAG